MTYVSSCLIEKVQQVHTYAIVPKLSIIMHIHTMPKCVINGWYKIMNTLEPYVMVAQGLCEMSLTIHFTCWGCCKKLLMIRQVGSVQLSMEHYVWICSYKT